MESLLQRLTACHSTPGDEGEVRDVLEACWRGAGWQAERQGDYAVTARASGGPRVRADSRTWER